ncbi:MAG: hypothetical protein M1451_01420, partial [Acidobacteria bacterium]|nr:hypothetical protein [Acidobacteriota bacterium]
GLSAGTAKESQERPPTKSQMAYELYLRASERLSRLNRWDTRTTIEMLENATNLDPRFAVAWARLAEGRVVMGMAFEPGPLWFKRADVAAKKALALDPTNADAQCAMGRVLWTPMKGFKNREALRILTTALRLNPGCHSAQIWRCMIQMHVGLVQEAHDGLIEALATHPDDPFTLVFIGQAALQQFDFEAANEYNVRALSLDRGHIWANVFYPTIALYRDRLEDAEERIQQARQMLPGDAWLTSCEALLWAKRGEMRKAEHLAGQALRGGKPLVHMHHMWHTAACVYAMIGKPARAIGLLQKCARQGLPNYTQFRDDPHFAAMRRHAGFVKLMASLKKEWEKYKNEFADRN